MATNGAPSDTGGPDVKQLAPGDAGGERFNRLFVLVQDELHRVALGQLAGERAGHTLSTAGLVNETYLKLAKQRRVDWSDRAQFFALAATAMRRILIDYARRHRGARNSVRYDSSDRTDDGMESTVRIAAAQRGEELLALDEALERLASHDTRLSRVVECRFFAGYTEAETAEALGVTSRTATRDWARAKAWLYQELKRGDASPNEGAQ